MSEYGITIRQTGPRGADASQQLDLLYEGDPSVYEALGLVESARAILRLMVLNGMKKPAVRPCNEMGGGSAGLDTAEDFAMHCGKEDRHDGPHSFEEDQ